MMMQKTTLLWEKETACGRNAEAEKERDGVYLIQQGAKWGWLKREVESAGLCSTRSIQGENTTQLPQKEAIQAPKFVSTRFRVYHCILSFSHFSFFLSSLSLWFLNILPFVTSTGRLFVSFCFFSVLSHSVLINLCSCSLYSGYFLLLFFS